MKSAREGKMTDEFETSIEKTRKIILHKYTGDEPNVFLPDGINIIGNQAFSNNTKLISLIISEGVTEICKGSFENCSNLSSIFIPESVATIESGAFQNCNNLKSVIISSEGLNICPGMFSSKAQIRIYFPHKTRPFSFFTDGLFERQTLFDHSNKLIENLLGFAKANYPLEPKLMKLCEYGMINNLSQYDSLVFAMNSIVIWKVYIAICRLEYPIELNEEYRKKYIYYLKNNADLFMPEFINDGDIESISILAENLAIPQDKIDTFIEQAIELSQVEILAVLMNHKHETWGMSYEVSLELESKHESDWETLENWDDTLTIRKYVGNNSDVIIPAKLNGKQVSRIEGILGSLNVSVFFLVIHAPEGSYAIEYAKENNIDFVEI
jgi:hypothetical protein